MLSKKRWDFFSKIFVSTQKFSSFLPGNAQFCWNLVKSSVFDKYKSPVYESLKKMRNWTFHSLNCFHTHRHMKIFFHRPQKALPVEIWLTWSLRKTSEVWEHVAVIVTPWKVTLYLMTLKEWIKHVVIGCFELNWSIIISFQNKDRIKILLHNKYLA